MNPFPTRRPLHRQAFTLVELLVVISIIALLLGILLPSLSKALRQAKATQCQSQMRQLISADLMYAGENDGFLMFCNSDSLEKDPTRWPHPGWLYDYTKDNARNKAADVEDGLMWPYLHERKVYRCPLDNGPWAGTQNMTSYMMSSVVRGFDAFVTPSVKLVKFNADSILLWEADETNKNWNDGNNDPWAEVISSRHDGAGTAGFADSHVELVRFEQYFNWQKASFGPNPLWCNPLTADGMR